MGTIVCLFETSKRRIQYSLFTATEILKSFGIIFYNKLIKEKGLIKNKTLIKILVNNWQLFCLQMTFSLLVFLKSINKTQYCSSFSSLVLNTFF